MSGGNAGVSNPSTQRISSPANDGWHTAEHGALSAWNGAANVANQVGAFLGLPSWTTEPIADVVNPKAKKPVSNNKPTLNSTLSDFSNSAGNWLMPAVEGFFKGSTYTDTAHSTGSYLSNVGSAINREGAYATNVVESRFGNQSAIDRLNQMSVQQQQNLSDGAVQNVLKPAIATPAVHVAGKVVNSAFDNVQHMYRAAALAYDKEGLQGALSVLTPAIVGAIVGSLVGNPEIGFASAGLTGESAAAAGESIAAGGIPSTTEGLAAYNVAGRAVTDAATPASEGAATQGPRVVDEQAASKAATAAKIVRGAGSVISKPLGATVKGLGKLTQSTANLGGQIGEQVWYLPGSPEHDYWIKGRVATGDLSTLGRGLSESLGMGKNSWLSGTTDAIVALTEAPQMAGRAAAESNGSILGQLVSGHSITAVDSTAVDTAYRTNSGVKRTIDEILQMAKDPKRQKDLAGAIVRRYKDLEAIAPDLAKVAQKEGATSWDLVKEIGALADLEGYKAIHIPTTGLYGMIKGAKLSDGRISSAFSQFLGQSPMSFSEVQKNITTLSLDFNDKNFGYKLGQLLQQTGMKSSHITRLVSDAVMSTNPAELENVLKRALTENFYQRIDARILQFIGKIDGSKEWQKAFEAGQLTPEQVAFLDERLNAQGIEKVYHGLRESISKAVDNLVTSAPGRDGEYSREGIGGNTDSKLADSTHGALSENQTGHIVLPDYIDFDKQLRELFKTLDRANINDRAQSFNDFLGSKVIDGKYLGVETLDQWVNERFFKPLALLSPGWALRVSLSELTLNTIRLGPINMLASRQTAGMVKTSTKIFAKGQEYGDAHLNNLESYASKLEKKIVKAQTEGDGLKERQVQKELNELRNHIDYLRSPAGTEKPTTLNVPTNIPFPKGGTTSEHLIYDGGAPGMETVNGITYDNAVKNADELQTRIDNNIANRTKPEADRARGAINGVVDRIIADIKRNQPDWYKAQIERDLVTNIEQFVRMIGVHLFDVGPEGGVRISNVFRAKDLEKAGEFNFADGTIKIWGRAFANGIDQTTLHELWHHLSQFVPKDAIDGIEKELFAARKKFLDKNNLVEFAQKKLEGLPKDINHSAYHGDRFSPQEDPYYAELRFWRKFLDKSPASLENNTAHFDEKLWGELPMSYKGTDGYRLTNTDEWFAETMRDMTNGEMKYRNPVMEIGHRLLNLFWSALNKTIGTAQSKAIFNNFIKHRYSEANWDWGSLQYRANGDNALNITANQEASKINSSALNPPDRLTIPDIQKHLADKGYKIPMTAAANLAMIARGAAVGLDQAIITAFGREEFIKNAAFLIYRHGGYLPPSADSRHMLPLSMVDISQPIERVGKRTLRKSAEDEQGNAIRGYKYDTAGKLKTKVVVIGPKPRFKSVNFLGNGYFEGWQYMAATMAGSPLLQRPLAGAYLEFVRQGLDGIELRQAAENEARRLIEAMPANDRMRIARSEIPAMGDEGRSPIDSWAEKLVNNLEATASHPIVASRATLTEEERLQGKTPGVIGYNPNRKLLEDIANNNLPVTVEDFQKEYTRYIENADGVRRPDPLQNPKQVTSRLPRIFGGWDLIGKLSSAGHTKVLGPMVNYMSRQPTYIAEFMAERKALENRVKAGFLNADQADVIAETAAAKNMVLYIHNPADKTKFEEMMRIGAPFYFAQNQAWRRVGRLFADNPGAFMQYAQTMYGVQMLAQQITNKNGMSIVAIPSLMLYGVPFMGSLTSLQTMDPFTTQSDAAGNTDPFASVIEMFKPHPGPLVTIPLEALQAWFPWQQDRIKKTIDPVVGPIGANQSFGQNLFGTFVPNSIARNVIEGVRGYASSNAGSDFTLNSYNDCKLEAFTYTATEMQREEWNKLAKTQFSKNPEEDNRVRRAEFAMWQSKTFGANADSAQQQKFLDQANNRAGLIWAAKLGLGLFSPVALSTGNAEQGLVSKFNNYIKDPKYAGDYNKAVSAFLRDNPYGTLATMYKSKSVRGNTIPETQTAFNYVDKNFDIINQYPYAALAYGPNLSADTKFYYPAYQLELADGLRQRQTPDAFYKSFLIANGNAYYYDAVKPYYEAHKNAPGAYAWKTKQIDNYGNNFNTVWRSNYKLESSIGIHAQALQELNQMMLLPQYKNLPVTKNYEQIMGWVNTILAEAIKQAKSGNVSYQQVQDWWQSKMDAYKKIYPEATPGIDAVFYNQG